MQVGKLRTRYASSKALEKAELEPESITLRNLHSGQKGHLPSKEERPDQK